MSNNLPAQKSNRAIQIEVHTKASTQQKHGTFTGPAPKLRVDPGDTITFSLKVVPDDKNAVFSVRFLNGITPLVDEDGDPVIQFGPRRDSVDFDVTSDDPFPTEYSYQVHVLTSGGEEYSIDHCPLVDDSGN